MIEAIILVVFPFCMLFAATSDLLSMTIANRVPLILVGTFVAVAPFTGMEMTAIGWHLLAAAIVLVVTFGLFAMGGMGGGDAKLLAATALWMGFGFPLMAYLLTAATLGGVLTILILMYRGSAFAMLTDRTLLFRNFASGTKGVPYAIALGSAGLAVYPTSPLMVWAIARLAGQ